MLYMQALFIVNVVIFFLAAMDEMCGGTDISPRAAFCPWHQPWHSCLITKFSGLEQLNAS